MIAGNKSNVNEFKVEGFTDSPQLRYPLFILFLAVYLVIILSNLTIFISIISDSHLHSPMYIFLCNLSVLDICYTSTVLPKFLIMIFTQHKVISFAECIAQLYFFFTFASVEFFLLAVMAYDRYVAICRPLHYSLLMSPMCCLRLTLATWIGGLCNPVIYAVAFANFSFCSSHDIDHFFCDIIPLIKLSCSDTSTIEIWTYIFGTILGGGAFMLTLLSYVSIIHTIINMHSASGRHKTFSTCASHLTCVIIFYGTMICLYIRPAATYSPDKDKYFALLYIVLIPMLNPLIYTLKNKDFKNVFKKMRSYALCHKTIINASETRLCAFSEPDQTAYFQFSILSDVLNII